MAGRSRTTLVVGLVAFVLLVPACDLPTLREARRQADALPETSFLYAADGTPITRLHAGVDRVSVGAGRIPDVVRAAVVAVEDQRFYDHKGLDLRALLRAAYVDTTTGEVVEGGSTITQQLVKNVYVGGEQTIARKLREAHLAWELEHQLTKERILTKYLNTVYFGNGAYGIMAAARTYFDKEPVDLTLEEAAFCRRKGITITTFMLATDYPLLEFVRKLTALNHGRIYETDPNNIGAYVFRDFVRNRRKRLH